MKANLSAASGWSGLGAVSARARRRAHWHGNAEVSQGCNRGRRSTFAMSSADFVAGAALSQSQVQISWQAQYYCKVKYRLRCRRSIFARSSADFVAGAALSQGEVQILWQGQYYCKVKSVFRGRGSILAR